MAEDVRVDPPEGVAEGGEEGEVEDPLLDSKDEKSECGMQRNRRSKRKIKKRMRSLEITFSMVSKYW